MHIIKASQIRALVDLLSPSADLDNMKIRTAVKAIFPEAYRWEKLTEERVRFKAHSFAGNEFGIDVYDGNEYVGVYRPNKEDNQEFLSGDFVYHVVVNSKTASLSVYRCKE